MRLVSVGVGPFRFTGPGALLLWLVGWLLVGVARLIYVAASHPRAACAVAGAALTARLVAAQPMAAALLLAAGTAGGEVWHLLWPRSFRRQVGLRALTVARSVGYRLRWARACAVAGLTLDEHVPPRHRIPRLRAVRCLEHVDVLRVRAVLGQRFDDWETAAPMIAHALGATDVRVHRGDDRRLSLELGRGRRGRSWDREGILER